MRPNKYELERRFQQQVTLATVGFLIAVSGSLVPHFWWMSEAGDENQGIFRALSIGVFCFIAGTLWLLSTDNIALHFQQQMNWSAKTYLSCWTLAVGFALAGWAIPMVIGSR